MLVQYLNKPEESVIEETQLFEAQLELGKLS